jgi:hypothetical protein
MYIDSIPMRKERMEMFKIDQTFKPAGWMMTDRNGGCAQILPSPGTTILIGRTKPSGRTKTGKVNLIWVEDDGDLVVIPLNIKGNSLEFEMDGRQYFLTIENPSDARIGGSIKGGSRKKTPFDPAGTWGADVNPGGGSGVVAPVPRRSK